MSAGTWTQAPRRPSIPRSRPRLVRSRRMLLALVVTLVIAGLGWLWFRGSSFVRIRQVTVTGLSGPQVKQIRQALTVAAESMTTMSLSVSKLDDAVAGYPVVTSLKVSTRYPHGLTIAVAERVPVATVTVGGQMVVVDADGRLLPGSTIAHGLLPSLVLGQAPAGGRITAAGAAAAVKVLRAAPYAFIAKVAQASYSAAHGVILQLRDGPALYFGPPTQLALKWVAATATLANSASHGADYIDVSDPHRPASGVPVSVSHASTTTDSTTPADSTTTP